MSALEEETQRVGYHTIFYTVRENLPYPLFSAPLRCHTSPRLLTK